ncbi:MAG TPA: hypothetical protein ENI15_00150 [Spirochaetes bacterium]|nr:hypothetical protein [Spirochaetota bacterium]
MDIQFLTKQLLLMFNIAHIYPGKVQKREWKQLCDLLVEKRDYLNSIIDVCKNEKLRIKAHQAFDQLNKILI